MNTSVVLLNGPPLCGKDSGADYLYNHYMPCKAAKKEFKKKLYDLVMTVYSVKPDRFWQIYNDRALKEQPLPEFDGLSVRQAMIKVSEEVIKPIYGKRYFGIAAARELEEGAINIFSDSGFIEEVEPIAEKIGKENILLIRIYRNGCEYTGDSRNYLPAAGNLFVADVSNDGSLIQYNSSLVQIVKDFLVNKDKMRHCHWEANCSVAITHVNAVIKDV